MSAEGRRAIRSLTTDSIQRNLRHFLCDDSAGPDAALAILSRADFVPDTFTVADRLNGRAPLSGAEPTGIDWMREIVCGELDRMRESGALEAGAEPGLEDACAAETARFLACRHHDAPIAESITNQELPDVVRRIIAYCLFGDPAKELDTHQRFNTIGFELASRIIEDHMLRSNPSTKELLAYSIAAGLIGLDLKGAAAAASGFSVEGIRLAGVADRAVRNTAGPVWAELQRIARAGLAVDHWDTFAAEIAASNRRLVWFTDDYIESLFDLVLMQRLLVEYSGLSILLVPKKGRHANDLAYEDVDRFLESPWLQPLARERSTGRFQACPHGPRMGTVNLRKLSPELVRELAGDVTVYVKGCRAHELIQGGLNRISYTAYVVAREFSEAETGLDARENPLLFFRGAPGEYAYWGFEGRACRRKIFPDGRGIAVCYSTLSEHLRRRGPLSLEDVVSELKYLCGLSPDIRSRHAAGFYGEAAPLCDRLNDLTRASYTATAKSYGSVRGDAPLGPDIDLINALLARARRLAGRGAAGADPKMRLLDVGTGHGRDLSYFARMKDVDAYGIDTADGFLEMLRERQRCETIPRWRVLGMDMRHLAFKDETFDIVRHNATLLHLPLIGPGYGVDEALAETYRILRPNGVLYALVKAGDGMAIFDTREGLGPRFFQFFSERTLEECVCRNGFEACEITRHSSQRAGRLIEWLSITAQRAGNIAPGG